MPRELISHQDRNPGNINHFLQESSKVIQASATQYDSAIPSPTYLSLAHRTHVHPSLTTCVFYRMYI